MTEIFAPNYRKTPKNIYPSYFDDMHLWTDYLLNNADKYNVNANRYFLMGDSAGANGVNAVVHRFMKSGRKELPFLVVCISGCFNACCFGLPSHRDQLCQKDFPLVRYALYAGCSLHGERLWGLTEKRKDRAAQKVIDGHVMAIRLSEPGFEEVLRDCVDTAKGRSWAMN